MKLRVFGARGAHIAWSGTQRPLLAASRRLTTLLWSLLCKEMEHGGGNKLEDWQTWRASSLELICTAVTTNTLQTLPRSSVPFPSWDEDDGKASTSEAWWGAGQASRMDMHQGWGQTIKEATCVLENCQTQTPWVEWEAYREVKSMKEPNTVCFNTRNADFKLGKKKHKTWTTKEIWTFLSRLKMQLISWKKALAKR